MGLSVWPVTWANAMGTFSRSLRCLVLVFAMCLLVMALATPSAGCSVGAEGRWIHYYNATDSVLWINVDIVSKTFSGPHKVNPRIRNDGPIDPGTSRTFDYRIPSTKSIGEQIGKYVITAIAADGTTVYQRIFTWSELDDSGWRIVIEPQ